LRSTWPSVPGTFYTWITSKIFTVISAYSRQQAIDDGVLVDVSAQARETGILLPTVLTTHLHQVLEDIPEESRGRTIVDGFTMCSG
jgi:hypothetical protein